MKKIVMTWRKLVLTLLLGALIVIGIAVLGPLLSKKIDRDDRKRIDENGTELKGIIIRKREYKGREIYFKYRLKEVIYTNYEDSKLYYELDVGDSVLVKVDSVRPKNSYIIRKW